MPTDSDDNLDELQWIDLKEDAFVTTADLCEFFGGCPQCPGFAKVADLNPDHPEPNATVFCTHWCHEVAPKV